MNVEGLKTLIK